VPVAPGYGFVVLSRWRGGLAAAVVTAAACVLVVLDVTDAGMRRWWEGHALTSSTVAGLLVLLITLLVADQVVRLRQINGRARALAVQAAIMMTQANRASLAVSEALARSGDRDVADDEFRTYTMMLLSVAPVLIDDKTSRNFLEQAQHLDGEMAWALSVLARKPGEGKFSATRLDAAVQGLMSASTPLLQSLDPEVRSAVRGDDPT
jgi:hypothetical protein